MKRFKDITIDEIQTATRSAIKQAYFDGPTKTGKDIAKALKKIKKGAELYIQTKDLKTRRISNSGVVLSVKGDDVTIRPTATNFPNKVKAKDISHMDVHKAYKRESVEEGKGFLEYDEWLKKEKGIKKGRKGLNSAKHKTYATEWRAYVKDLFGKLPPLPSMVESKLDDEENELLDTDSVEEAKPYKGDKEKLAIMKKWNISAGSLLGIAIRIAVDMGGNMTGAVKKIEQLKRGLSKKPAVKEALRVANEAELEDTDKDSLEEAARKAIEEANIVKVVDGLVDKIANSGNFKGAIAWQEYEDTRKKNSKYDAKDKKKAEEIIKKFKIK
jgi:hypothetical protein